MLPDIHSVAGAGRTDVLAALRTASRKTGLDFDYLLNTAMRESGLNVQAKSKTSSASGLFQFVEQTWLGLVKHHGVKAAHFLETTHRLPERRTASVSLTFM